MHDPEQLGDGGIGFGRPGGGADTLRIAIYQQFGNQLGKARALNNLSNVMSNVGDLAGSLEYSHCALEIHRKMGNPRGQSAALNNLGAPYFMLKDYDDAQRVRGAA